MLVVMTGLENHSGDDSRGIGNDGVSGSSGDGHKLGGGASDHDLP